MVFSGVIVSMAACRDTLLKHACIVALLYTHEPWKTAGGPGT